MKILNAHAKYTPSGILFYGADLATLKNAARYAVIEGFIHKAAIIELSPNKLTFKQKLLKLLNYQHV